MKILRGKQPKPRRVLLYGQHGIGKSTWAAQAPRPLFLNIEDGLSDIACDKTEKLSDLSSVTSAIGWLLNNDHGYQSVVIDTADWLEKLIFAAVASDAGKPNIAEIGFGKGYVAGEGKLEYLLTGLDKLSMRRNMLVIVLAHARIVRFENPETAAYDRYELDLHKSLSGKIQEWCDEVFFASFRVFTRKEDLGFGRERTTAIGGTDRYIRTTETAVASAKNRLGLPTELPMDFAAYAHYFPAAGGGNISQVVGEIPAEPAAAAATAQSSKYETEAGEFFENSTSGVVDDGRFKTKVKK